MSVSLNVHVVGTSGPPVVMLHGWGLNSALWEDTASSLENFSQNYLVDLPGHGLSAALTGERFDLPALADAVMQQVPDKSIFIGWSLGGLIAQYIASEYPERIARLILVASNACFVQQTDWPVGMKPEVLNAFSESLEQDYQATILRFLSLQARGGDQAREVIRVMRERVFARGKPQISALRGGLSLLQNENRVADLEKIRCPTLLVYGGKDMLVPAQAGTDMQRRIKNSQLILLESAAHAPFITHADEFVAAVKTFLD